MEKKKENLAQVEFYAMEKESVLEVTKEGVIHKGGTPTNYEMRVT